MDRETKARHTQARLAGLRDALHRAEEKDKPAVIKRLTTLYRRLQRKLASIGT